jgi:hypothetical protein
MDARIVRLIFNPDYPADPPKLFYANARMKLAPVAQ